jgi:hypothetical protein
MPPEMKEKMTLVANGVQLENRFAGTEKWPLAASRERAGFATDANRFTLQLVNLQNALGRANGTVH